MYHFGVSSNDKMKSFDAHKDNKNKGHGAQMHIYTYTNAHNSQLAIRNNT